MGVKLITGGFVGAVVVGSAGSGAHGQRRESVARNEKSAVVLSHVISFRGLSQQCNAEFVDWSIWT